MKKRVKKRVKKKLIFIVILLIILLAFGLYIKYYFNNKITGKAVSNNFVDSNKKWILCSERGNVVIALYNKKVGFVLLPVPQVFRDSCTNSIFKNYSCDGKKPYYIDMNCENGCESGKCKPSLTIDSTTTAGCIKGSGDLNKDGIVDDNDKTILSNNWGKKCTSPTWCKCSDINQDGKVSSGDLVLLGNQYTAPNQDDSLMEECAIDCNKDKCNEISAKSKKTIALEQYSINCDENSCQENSCAKKIAINHISMDGSGTEENPYQIKDCLQLESVGFNLDANYILANNIDCVNTINWNNGEGFEPIGPGYHDINRCFKGKFNGNGYIIYNLFIGVPAPATGRLPKSGVGLFGCIYNAELKNLILINSNINGGSATGD